MAVLKLGGLTANVYVTHVSGPWLSSQARRRVVHTH